MPQPGSSVMMTTMRALVTMSALGSLLVACMAAPEAEELVLVDEDRQAMPELQWHYGYAVEFRVVYPCLQTQLDTLRDRVMESREVLQPAPIYHEDERAGSGINVDLCCAPRTNISQLMRGSKPPLTTCSSASTRTSADN